MPGVKVADLRAKTKSLEVEHNEFRIEFKYAPDRYDSRIHDKITSVGALDDPRRASELLADLLSGLLIWWNLEETDGTMTPLTREGIIEVSVPLLNKIVVKVMEDVQGRPNASSSSASSPPEARPEPVPIGTAPSVQQSTSELTPGT